LFFLDSQIGWAVGYEGAIITTKNGGANWYKLTPLSNNNLTSITFINRTTGWITGDKGTILKTYNGDITGVKNNFEKEIQTSYLLSKHTQPV
jgi:photosystem II stability/assembly factor-like uncharacterized protein